MTKAVRKLINLKQRHYKTWMSTRLAEHLNLFKKTRRILSVRLEVQRENLRKNGNKKPITRYMKSKTKSRTNVGPLRVGSEMISNNKEMTTILNRSFCNVFSQEDTNNVNICPTLPSISTISDVLFTERNLQNWQIKN